MGHPGQTTAGEQNLSHDSPTPAPTREDGRAGLVVRIEPTSGWRALRLRELWEYRELLAFLVWRDVKVRYRQTTLGALWAILQPVLLMLVFTALSRVASGAFRVSGVPYPVFVFCGLVPWLLFAQTLSGASNSLVSDANLVSKVYFPRLVLPIAAAGSYLMDFAIAFIVLLALMVGYGVVPGAAVVLVPAFALFAVAAALAVGIWLTALNVRYRDVKHAVPFLVQLWFFASPVFYSSTTLIPERWRVLYGLNPMAGVIEGFRWSLLGEARPGVEVLVSLLATVALLVGGIAYFQRVERQFADVI